MERAGGARRRSGSLASKRGASTAATRPRGPPPPPPPSHDSDAADATGALVARSARGATYLMAVVAAQRLLTFGLNALLIRSVSPEVLGFAGSDMELLLSTILFLSREAARLVALRAPLGALSVQRGGSGVARQQLVNLAWTPVPLGAALAVAAAAVFARRAAAAAAGGKDGAPSSSSSLAGEAAGVAAYCLASLVETLGEPAFILGQAALLYGGRASAEVAAVVAKVVVTYVLVAVVLGGGGGGSGSGGWWLQQVLTAPLAFGLGQLAYATVLAGGYWVALLRHVAASTPAAGGGGGSSSAGATLRAARTLLPRQLPVDDAPKTVRRRHPHLVGAGVAARAHAWLAAQVGAPQLALLRGLAWQGGLKHLLTEGDRLLLTQLATRPQRGVYAAVSSYGSLVVRLLFAPLEEATRGLLSKLLSSSSGSGSGDGDGGSNKAEEGGSPVAPPSAAASSPPATAGASSGSGSLRRRRSRPANVPLPDGGAVRKQAAGEAADGTPTAPSSTAATASSAAAASSALRVYTAVLSLVLPAGLAITALGPPLAGVAAGVLLGPRWRQQQQQLSPQEGGGSSSPPSALDDAAGALAAYCVYVSSLAVNGVTEALATAACGASGLATYNAAMAAVSAGYAAAAVAGLAWGGIPGLLVAGCANMAARVGVAWAVVLAPWAASHGLSLRGAVGAALPSPATGAAFVAAAGGLTALRWALRLPPAAAAGDAAVGLALLASPRVAALVAGGAVAAAGVAGCLWACDRARLAGSWAWSTAVTGG
jgi:hypothetical protein